jgi:Flp pilus assembly protein TadG
MKALCPREGGLHSDTGAAAVEFALLLPIFLILLFGIVDISLLVYSKSVLGNAAYEGARLATLGASVADVRASSVAAASGLVGSPPGVQVTCTQSPATECNKWTAATSGFAPSGAVVKVTLTYQNSWLTPVAAFIPSLGPSMTINGASTMVVE